MASKLAQLQSKACHASKFVSKHGGAYYKQLLEQNKQYIQDPPTVEKCNLLSKQLLYTRLARFVFLSPFHLTYTKLH
jgi:F-type H+-transporting ATPase subunit g